MLASSGFRLLDSLSRVRPLIPRTTLFIAALAENIQGCKEFFAVEELSGTAFVNSSNVEVCIFLATGCAFSHLREGYQKRCRRVPKRERTRSGPDHDYDSNFGRLRLESMGNRSLARPYCRP
jgi:hypothetical protein